MASNYWIKLYHEILHDKKMARLPDNIWRRVIELFLLAGEYNTAGNIPSTIDIAWELRLDEVELSKELAQIEKLGIITQTETGWLVVKFADRQSAASSTERSRQRRQRMTRDNLSQRNEIKKEMGQNVSGGATNMQRNVAPDTDTDTDTDDDNQRGSNDEHTAAASFQAITANYEDFISVNYSSVLVDEFNDYAKYVQPQWVASAFKVAEAQNVRKWAYIRAILDSCISAGGWVDKHQQNSNGSQPPKKREAVEVVNIFGQKEIMYK